MKYIYEDKDIEEAMLKSCLLYSNKNIKSKKNHLFEKFVLSLVISDLANSKKTIKDYITEHNYNFIIDDSRLDVAINQLEKNELITINKDIISLKSGIKTDANNYVQKITNELDRLVEDILKKVQEGYKKSINNPVQVKSNIKECINYYYEVTGHSFFELDKRKNVKELKKLEEISSNNINTNDKDELGNLIIYAIGSILDSPNDAQQEVLESIARIYITTQIMNIDPLLTNFKSSIIKEKVFILDTDVVLYAITDNATKSKQYKMMINQLISCGCNIYIPEEVIKEVYNHAEAARKRYEYISYIFDNQSNWVINEFKNVFIEDYYLNKRFNSSNVITWEQYINNFHNSKYDYDFILEQIKEKLGNKIRYCSKPDGVNISEDDLSKLESATLNETNKTERAIYRNNNKNADIANTDAILYLSIKSLNEINDNRNGNISPNKKPKLLISKYYILTTSLRVHYCAKKLGLSANILCHPLSLMAYLSETGIIAKDKIKITSLFDNPFLLHTANVAWEDIQTLVKSGVDIQGKNIVTMRYELREEIENMLTSNTASKYKDIYNSTKKKGYNFEPHIEKIMQESGSLKDTVEDLKQKIQEMKNENEKTKKIIEIKDKIIRREKYEERKGHTLRKK